MLQKTKLIYNENHHYGMFSSIQKGLNSIKNTDPILLQMIDQPFVPIEIYKDLVKFFQPSMKLLQPSYHKKAGHPLIFSTQFKEFYSPDISTEVKARTRMKPGILSGLSNSNIMVRREVFAKIGVYNPLWQTGELMEWWSRAQEHDIVREEINQVLAWRRLHDNNLSRNAAQEHKDYLGIIKASLDRRRK